MREELNSVLNEGIEAELRTLRTQVSRSLDLAGALLIAGYRQVVAAAWAVTDESASEVVRLVYGRATSATAAEPWVADALHGAVRAVRDRLPPVQWAGYRYSGV